MPHEIADKHQVLLKGGEFKEPNDTIENWLNFLTEPTNLQPGLSKLTVECLNYFGLFGSDKIHVSFHETKASLRTLHLELREDDNSLTVFQETDPNIIASKSTDLTYTAANPHYWRDWIFGLFKQTELEDLSVKFLNEQLPDLFDQLPKLRHVRFYGARLLRLPPSFFRLPTLISLDISESGISEVPPELQHVQSLRTLTFSQPCVPSVLGNLCGLETLTCNCSRFNIPEEITQLTELRQLSLRDVVSAPDNFLNFPYLEYLYFHVKGNRPAFIFTQANVPKLKKLNTNHPAAFTPSMASFKTLENFTLGDGIDGVYEPLIKSEADSLTNALKQLNSLIRLNLEGLGITDIEFCLSHPHLQYLYLGRNKIVNVPVGLGKLPDLKRLDLSKNSILHVPTDLNKLYESGALDVKDNPIINFPDLNFKDESKQNIVRTGGDYITEEPFVDWLTFITNPVNLQPGLPDINIRTDLIYWNDGTITVSFDKDKASIRSLKLVLSDADFENVAVFQDDPKTTETDTGSNPYHLKKWIFNLFLHTELEELEVQFLNKELPDLFGTLTKLQRIDLSNSQLTRLPPTLCQLPTLKFLRVNDTPLTELPDCFSAQSNLVRIDLSRTKLTQLPPSFFQLSALEILYLEGASITELPDSFEKLSNLKTINLSGSKIIQLPPSFVQLQTLENLYLENTFITDLSNRFNALSSLKKISLKGSKLRQLPTGFFQLPVLEWLDLRLTSIPEIPAEFGQLQTLRYLSYSQPCAPTAWTGLTELIELHGYCPNFEVPAEFSSLTNLKVLYLDSVSWASFDALNLPGLEKLEFRVVKSSTPFTVECNLPSLKELTTNHLAAFSAGIANAKNLEKIVAGSKDESGLQPLKESLKHLGKLTYLSLRGSRITDMEVCTSAVNVEYLDLSENNIVNIPEGLSKLQKLKTLILNKNPLVDFPELPAIPSLDKVEFRNTKMPEDEESGIRQPDAKILKRMAGNFPNAFLLFSS